MNAHTPFDAKQDWTNPYCQNSSNDPMVDALLGNAYHVVRTVYCNLGNLKLIYDFLNQYGMVLGVQSEAELKALTTKATFARIYDKTPAGDRQVTDYLYVEGDRTGVIPDDVTATGSWVKVATSGTGGDGGESTNDGGYIPWIYNSGSANGGETTIRIPDETAGAPFMIVNGDWQTEGYDFEYDPVAFEVSFATPLESGDFVVVMRTGVPATPDNPNVSDWVTLNWLYNHGAAVGGEQVIDIPYTFQSVPAVYKNGLRFYKGLANNSYTIDADNNQIILTEPLATNDRLIVQLGGEAKILEIVDHTVQEVARAANVKDSEVILSTDTTQFLNDKKIVYSVSEQKAYGLPALPTNVYIASVSNGQLTYQPGNVVVSLTPVPNSAEDLVPKHKQELAAIGGATTIGYEEPITNTAMDVKSALDISYANIRNGFSAPSTGYMFDSYETYIGNHDLRFTESGSIPISTRRIKKTGNDTITLTSSMGSGTPVGPLTVDTVGYVNPDQPQANSFPAGTIIEGITFEGDDSGVPNSAEDLVPKHKQELAAIGGATTIGYEEPITNTAMDVKSALDISYANIRNGFSAPSTGYMFDSYETYIGNHDLRFTESRSIPISTRRIKKTGNDTITLTSSMGSGTPVGPLTVDTVGYVNPDQPQANSFPAGTIIEGITFEGDDSGGEAGLVILQGHNFKLHHLGFLKTKIALWMKEVWMTEISNISAWGQILHEGGTSANYRNCFAKVTDPSVAPGAYRILNHQYGNMQSCASDGTVRTAYYFDNNNGLHISGCGSELPSATDAGYGVAAHFNSGNDMTVDDFYCLPKTNEQNPLISVGNDNFIIFNTFLAYGTTYSRDMWIHGPNNHIVFNNGRFSNGELPKIGVSANAAGSKIIVNTGSNKFIHIVTGDSNLINFEAWNETADVPLAAITFGSVTSDVGGATKDIKYTKTGNTVTVEFFIKLNGAGGQTGAMQIRNMPYPAKNAASGTISAYTGLQPGTPQLSVVMNRGSNVIQILKQPEEATTALLESDITPTAELRGTITYSIDSQFF
ncbi:tail fiber [Escherichia phage vB_Eco_F22]|nr:tail fiber [Escherichia phage vB_Eco_F22]